MSADSQHPDSAGTATMQGSGHLEAAGGHASRPERACCCTAKPIVVVTMPPSTSRAVTTDLWPCGHHYRKSQRALTSAGALSLPRPVQARGDVSHQTGGPSGRQYQARPGLSVQHVADGVVDGAARRVVGSGTAGDGRPVVWPPDPPSPRRIIHSATGNAAFPWRVLNCARPVPHRQAGLPGQAVRAGGQPASKTPMNRAASAGRTGRRAARAALARCSLPDSGLWTRPVGPKGTGCRGQGHCRRSARDGHAGS